MKLRIQGRGEEEEKVQDETRADVYCVLILASSRLDQIRYTLPGPSHPAYAFSNSVQAQRRGTVSQRC